MMDEIWLQLPKEIGVLFNRKMLLRSLRIMRGKGLLDQFSGKLDKRKRTLPRRIDEQLPLISLIAAAFVQDMEDHNTQCS